MKDNKTALSLADNIILKTLPWEIMVIVVYINLTSGLYDNKPFAGIILTSLHDLAFMCSILTYFRYPVLTMLLTFVSQWFLILEDCILGNGFLTALYNCGIIEVLVWCTIPIVLIYTIKHSDTKELKLKDKLKVLLFTDDEPIRLKWWQEFIVLCLSTTVILNTMNKYTLGFEHNQTLAKLFSIIVIVLATLVTVLRFIRFSIFYKIVVVLQAVKIISLFTVVKRSEIHTEDIVYVVIETLVILYATYLYYRYRENRRNKEDTKPKQVRSESEAE